MYDNFSPIRAMIMKFCTTKNCLLTFVYWSNSFQFLKIKILCQRHRCRNGALRRWTSSVWTSYMTVSVTFQAKHHNFKSVETWGICLSLRLQPIWENKQQFECRMSKQVQKNLWKTHGKGSSLKHQIPASSFLTENFESSIIQKLWLNLWTQTFLHSCKKNVVSWCEMSSSLRQPVKGYSTFHT